MFTYDERVVSDLYKDAYGVRPRVDFYRRWQQADEAGKQAIWDSLLEDHKVAVEREEEYRRRADASFEERIADTINLGAGNRASALRWIAQACDADSGEEVVYTLDLSSRYIAEIDQAIKS